MALWPTSTYPRYMDDCFHDLDRVERRMINDIDRFGRAIMPYWRDADHSILHVANQTQEVRVTYLLFDFDLMSDLVLYS